MELYCSFYYAKSHNIGKKFQRNFSYFLFLGENKYQYEENLNGIFTKHPRKPTIMVKTSKKTYNHGQNIQENLQSWSKHPRKPTIMVKTSKKTYNHGQNIQENLQSWSKYSEIFLVLQLKRNVIVSNEHGICKLPKELPNDLKLRKLRNLENPGESQNLLEL